MASEDPNAQLERAQEQVELHPESAKAQFNLGLAYSKRGVLKPAEAAYRKALEIEPEYDLAKERLEDVDAILAHLGQPDSEELLQ